MKCAFMILEIKVFLCGSSFCKTYHVLQPPPDGYDGYDGYDGCPPATGIITTGISATV